MVAAGPGPPGEHALISLLALNGLRVSEAIGADIEHLGLERGHWTLVITRKGGKVVTIPLAPARRRADRPPGRPPRRDHQECRSAHAAARIHHRQFGCRGPVARRAGSRLPCGPQDHDAIRPGPRQPGPARDLYCRRLRRRRRPVAPASGQQFRLTAATVRRTSAKPSASGNRSQPSAEREPPLCIYCRAATGPSACGHIWSIWVPVVPGPDGPWCSLVWLACADELASGSAGPVARTRRAQLCAMTRTPLPRRDRMIESRPRLPCRFRRG
jgi:hypothetical protein